LIVLDEPNANLDEAGEAALAQALQHVKEQGSTVFLITHRPGIVRLADRIVVMEQGRLDLYGEADAVKQTLAERVRAHSASKQLPVQPTTAPQLNGPTAADGSA